MHKPITEKELKRLEASGAKMSYQVKRVKVPELEALTERIGDLVKAKHDPIDLRDALTELTGAVKELKLDSQNFDTAPLMAALAALQANISQPVQRPSYKFTVERNARGQIESVLAVPANG